MVTSKKEAISHEETIGYTQANREKLPAGSTYVRGYETRKKAGWKKREGKSGWARGGK